MADAGSLPALLDAASEAFEVMLAVIRQHDHAGSPVFVPMVLAGASAANGRDHVLFAPSLPPRRLHQDAGDGGPDPMAGPAAAAWLAGLSGALAGRLTAAAVPAGSPADQRACLDAAQCAREIRAVLGGVLP